MNRDTRKRVFHLTTHEIVDLNRDMMVVGDVEAMWNVARYNNVLRIRNKIGLNIGEVL